jgi:hypothetical protein
MRAFADASSYIFNKQLLWAQRKRLELCGSAGDRGRHAYTLRLKDNLFESLTDDARREYGGGDGGELGRKEGRPGKMQAIHSSSALGCNTFHYWRRIGASGTVLAACGITTRGITGVQFEGHLPISDAFRYAPNLDVVVTYGTSSDVAAIECKFGEPFSTREKAPLSAKYLDDSLGQFWEQMPALRSLAAGCANPSSDDFRHLDAPQLLKHLLGLRRRSGARGNLLYLFYDVPGAEGARHCDEISRFTEATNRDGVRFTSLSYQTLLLRLSEQRTAHREWVDYMTERYL